MKITNRQYAQGLFEATYGKKTDEVKSALKNFIAVLINNNDQGRINGIVEEFNRLWNEAEGLVEAKVETANELDKSTLQALSRYVSEISEGKKVELDNQVNQELLGGFVLRFGDQIIDNSLKTKIKGLKNSLEK